MVETVVCSRQAQPGYLDPTDEPLRGVLPLVENWVKEHMTRYDASHDYHHIERVVALSRQIWIKEQETNPGQYDWPIIHLAALTHDICDKKYLQAGDNATDAVRERLESFGIPPDVAAKVQLIGDHVSYSNEVKNKAAVQAALEEHAELGVVQDADRLDAIGAVGVGRCFTYHGAKNLSGGMQGAVEHFEEKLLKIERLMKTETGRTLAHERTQRIREFLGWWRDEVDGAARAGEKLGEKM